jgi:DNA primase
MNTRYKKTDTERLKRSIDTARFYSRETEYLVRNEDGWQSALCPIHGEHHPSLQVLIPDGAFRCLACGVAGGDVISFIMQKNRIGFLDAVHYLKREYGGAV